MDKGPADVRTLPTSFSNQAEGSANGGDGRRWTAEEDQRLRDAVEAIGAANWRTIAREWLGGARSDVQCLHRWNKILRPGLVKGPWTDEEDAVILGCIARGVTKWSEIADRIPGRLGKQVRACVRACVRGCVVVAWGWTDCVVRWAGR